MAYRILMISLLLLFITAAPVQAAVKIPTAEQTELSRAEKRELRQQKRIERRFERLQKRLERRSDDEDKSNLGIWLIIIGSVLVLGGLLLGIFSFAAPLGGLFYFLSGLGLTFGLIVLIFRIHRKND